VAEVLGRNCRFLQGPDTDPAAVAEIRAAVDEKRACVVEILNYRRDGTPFWNRLSITPVRNERGEVTHYIGIQSDVTARREAENGLRRQGGVSGPPAGGAGSAGPSAAGRNAGRWPAYRARIPSVHEPGG
jgi:hypothetical protein